MSRSEQAATHAKTRSSVDIYRTVDTDLFLPTGDVTIQQEALCEDVQ